MIQLIPHKTILCSALSALLLLTFFNTLALAEPKEDFDKFKGTWAAGAIDEPFETWLDFTEEGIFIRSFHEDSKLTFEGETISDDLYKLTGTLNKIQMSFTMFPQTPDRLLIFLNNEDELAHARRITPVDKTVLGEWQVHQAPTSQTKVNKIIITEENFTIFSNKGNEVSNIYGLAPLDNAIEMLLIFPQKTDGTLIKMTAIPGGGYLFWKGDKDHYLVLYKKDEKPDWIETLIQPELKPELKPVPPPTKPN